MCGLKRNIHTSNKSERNVNLFWWWGLSINFQCSKWQSFSSSLAPNKSRNRSDSIEHKVGFVFRLKGTWEDADYSRGNSLIRAMSCVYKNRNGIAFSINGWKLKHVILFPSLNESKKKQFRFQLNCCVRGKLNSSKWNETKASFHPFAFICWRSLPLLFTSETIHESFINIEREGWRRT